MIYSHGISSITLISNPNIIAENVSGLWLLFYTVYATVVLLNFTLAKKQKVVKVPLPALKTRRLLMRVLNEDWWDVVVFHFTYAEWKGRFIITGHLFMTLYLLGRTPCPARHTSLHCLYVTAHVQYFPVSVFNPIKCLHVLSLRLQKG